MIMTMVVIIIIVMTIVMIIIIVVIVVSCSFVTSVTSGEVLTTVVSSPLIVGRCHRKTPEIFLPVESIS
jgi:hypothetical protein